MKTVMYLSISILCLLLSALIGMHIGSQSAQAQAPEPISGYRVVLGGGSAWDSVHYVTLSNGDVYARIHNAGGFGNGFSCEVPGYFRFLPVSQ